MNVTAGFGYLSTCKLQYEIRLHSYDIEVIELFSCTVCHC